MFSVVKKGWFSKFYHHLGTIFFRSLVTLVSLELWLLLLIAIWTTIYWLFTICQSLCALNKLFFHNSQIAISSKKKLSHDDEMTCTKAIGNSAGKLKSWVWMSICLMTSPLTSANILSCLSWEIDTTVGQGEHWDSGKCYFPCKEIHLPSSVSLDGFQNVLPVFLGGKKKKN